MYKLSPDGTKFKFVEYIDLNVDVTEIWSHKRQYYWLRERVCWFDELGVMRCVPKYFVCDGYSIPHWLRGTIRNLRSRVPAYCHDYCFVTGICSYHLSNLNLYRGIVATGSGRYNAIKVWAGTTLGGWIAWYKHKHGRQKMGTENYLKTRIAASETEADFVIAMC